MKEAIPLYQKSAQGIKKLTGTLLGSAIALISNSGISHAQNSDDLEFLLEEIIVTARKREEPLQDVPVAITAIPKSIVDDGNLDSMEKFMELVPNVALPKDGWTSADISIRGSGRISGDEDPGVGINRDGVYLGGLLTAFSNFYDIDRVEIMRGPQAGLYGRNAVGGAVNVTSVRPAFAPGGYLDVQLASKEHQELKGAANVVLIDDVLAMRVSGLYLDQKKGFDYVENQDQYLDAFDNQSARVRLLFKPFSGFELLTTVETFSSDGAILAGVHGPGATVANLTGVGAIAGTQDDATGHLQMSVQQFNEMEQSQFVQELNWELGNGTLTGIFSYRDTEAETFLDNDRTAIDLREHHLDSNQESAFAEIRYSGTFDNWLFTTGLTFLDENLSLGVDSVLGGEFGIDFADWYATGLVGDNPFDIPVGIPIDLIGLTPLGNSGGWGGALGDSFPAVWSNDQQLRSKAIFIEANYQVKPDLEVWMLFRYTEDTKDIAMSQAFGPSCPIACREVFTLFGIDAQVALDTSETWTNFSPAIGVNYTIDDALMVYAKYVTGFKAGGFNRIASSEEYVPFDSETTDVIEVGVKSQWLKNRLLFNAAAFYQQREDALVIITDPGMPIAAIGINAGEIHAQGFELELQARPSQNFNIAMSLGYLDSEFETFVFDGVDFSGKRTPNNFKYSVSGIISYEYPLNDAMDLFTFASYYTARDGFLAGENLSEKDEPETLDLRAGIKTANWKFSAFVDNALDDRFRSFELDPRVSSSHWGIFAPGRTFGLQAAYSFH